jgi:hypothetical protein
MNQLSSTSQWTHWFKIAAGCVLALSVIYFVIATVHWPLVGDASLIHYICFLMDHGMVPYRDLGDMNMPGSYLIEWSVMHTLGGGALAWRIFDFSLAAAALAAMVFISLPYDWFAGLFAGVLFMLAHGRDGIHQSGQRDLTLAVLLVIAYALLFQSWRKGCWWATGFFGLCAGIAATIKPTAIPLGILLLLMTGIVLRGKQQAITRHIVAGLIGLFVPVLGTIFFLQREHAISAFWNGLHTVVPYYASKGHRSLGYLLLHSFSPFMALVVLWIVLLVLALIVHSQRASTHWNSWEHAALWIGFAVGLAGFIAQRKGYPYHRYPFLAFLLLLMAIDFTLALRGRRILQITGMVGLAIGAFFLAPRSAYLTSTYDWHNQEFMTMLESDLNKLGGHQLSGHIQCIDSISGCNTTLYRMKLVQQTGMLSDFLVLGPENAPAVRETRAVFWREIHQEPPRVIVITSYQHPSGSNDFSKLDLWPQFEQYLAANYALLTQRQPPDLVRWWNHPNQWAAYRIYVLKTAAQ